MKHKLIFGFLIILGTFAKAQTNSNLYPFVQDKFWGFIDKNKNIVIKAQFEKVQNFENNLAIVTNYCSESGVINTSGNLIIPMNYNMISMINKELFMVEKNDKVGVMDIYGKTLIPCLYSDISNVGENLFLATLNEQKIIFNSKGINILGKPYDDININWDENGNFILIANLNEKIYIFDSKGNSINIRDVDQISLVGSNYFVALTQTGSEIYFDSHGKIYLNKFDIPSLSYEPYEDNGLWGFKYKDKIIQQATFSEVFFISETVWGVKLNQKWGIFDIKTNLMKYQAEFDELELMDNFKAIYVVKDGKVGLISSINFNTILPYTYDWLNYNQLVEESYDEAYINFSKNGKIGMLNNKNKIIMPCEFDNLFLSSPPVIIAQKDNKFGLYLTNGTEIQPCIFDTIEKMDYYFDESNIYITHKDSLLGAYTGTGIKIADPVYEEISILESEIMYSFSVKKKSKYGVLMLDNFEFISCEYDEPINFSDYSYYSNIPVIKNEKWGMVDYLGNIIIPCEYDNLINIDMFDENYARVSKNGKFGIIDISGKLVIPCKYSSEIDLSTLFYSKHVVVEDSSKYGIFDIEKGEIIPCILDEPPYEFMDLQYDYYTVISNGKYGLINKQAKIIVPFIYDNMYNEHENYRSGFFVVEKYEKRGLINKNNEIIIPIEYSEINTFDDNSCIFYAGRNDKYCIFNNKGIKLTEEKYESISYLGENLSIAYIGTDSTLIDSVGKLFTHPKINFQTFFNEGMSPYSSNNMYGFIDLKGNVVIPAQFNEVSSFSEGLAAVKLNDKWGVINNKGKLISPCQFDKIDDFEEGVASINLNKKMGVINKSGKTIIPPIYDEINFETPTIFSYKLNGKMGLINSKGEITTPAVFNRFHFYDTYIKGSTDSCEALINTKGVQVSDTIFDDIKIAGELFIVEIKDKYGLINNKGETVIPIEYGNIYYRDSEYFEIEKNDRYGVADLSGKIILPCIYIDIDFQNDMFYFKTLSENGESNCGIMPFSQTKIKRLFK